MHTVCFCQNVIEYQFHHGIQNLEWKPWQFKSCIFKLTLRYKCVLNYVIYVSDGIPRSVLKDWRKVRKLKQSGEAFLQDDSCTEIGPNVQKCRECRLDRSRKTHEPAISPVFCRFYYFRRSVFNTVGTVLGHMWTPCDTLHLGFIWFIIGAIFTQVS